MRTVKNTIICNAKSEMTSGEVDWELKYDILGQKNVDEADESDDIDDMVRVVGKGLYQLPIKIDKLEKILLKLKKKGCNYVSVEYNCDHQEYTFCGADVHGASESEISELVEKEKKEKLEEINRSLAKLEKEKERVLKLAEKLK